MKSQKGFTLVEILIVMTIIAILATVVIQNIVGFDSEAKITATKSNLNALRTSITLFRAKKGRYPESLNELSKETYLDKGVKKTFIAKMPEESISEEPNNTTEVQMSTETLSNNGGWTYFKDTAEVVVDITTPLDATWDEYAGEKPSEW
ncbi:MAG: type II secretion system protein [Candidatus Aureabacteria bacterium]|nr:type II secretion system protein [Candidatus Auribacterota bacterium]